LLRKRGGSTITQQTAKNVFTFCSRTWLRKGVEAYFTVLIELCWSKERILEVYLNSIEMGTNIYGAEAVAQEHFGCSAAKLSRRQCALVVATLPAPRKYSSKNPSKYMRKRQLQILRQMSNLGY
jgi:monofunctional biosynthetic peptidoglycan transglycosylase